LTGFLLKQPLLQPLSGYLLRGLVLARVIRVVVPPVQELKVFEAERLEVNPLSSDHDESTGGLY
jgi:hypothetical protein